MTRGLRGWRPPWWRLRRSHASWTCWGQVPHPPTWGQLRVFGCSGPGLGLLVSGCARWARKVRLWLQGVRAPVTAPLLRLLHRSVASHDEVMVSLHLVISDAAPDEVHQHVVEHWGRSHAACVGASDAEVQETHCCDCGRTVYRRPQDGVVAVEFLRNG